MMMPKKTQRKREIWSLNGENDFKTSNQKQPSNLEAGSTHLFPEHYLPFNINSSYY